MSWTPVNTTVYIGFIELEGSVPAFLLQEGGIPPIRIQLEFEDIGWAAFNTAESGNWGTINNDIPPSRAGISGVSISEVAVSGSTDISLSWTLIET